MGFLSNFERFSIGNMCFQTCNLLQKSRKMSFHILEFKKKSPAAGTLTQLIDLKGIVRNRFPLTRYLRFFLRILKIFEKKNRFFWYFVFEDIEDFQKSLGNRFLTPPLKG